MAGTPKVSVDYTAGPDQFCRQLVRLGLFPKPVGNGLLTPVRIHDGDRLVGTAKVGDTVEVDGGNVVIVGRTDRDS